MPVDTPMTNEMERTPYVTESLRVRCPACRKLYLVQFGDIQEAKPRFECVQCRGRFWLSLPDMDLSNELTGIPVQVKEVPITARARKPATKQETEPCPKCFKPVSVGASECGSCGVMIAKAKDSALSFTEPAVVPHSVALGALWKKIVADYNNETLHGEFLRMAAREGSLPYAAAMYGQMSKIMPTDEITRAKLTEIMALAEFLIPPTSTGSVAGLTGAIGSAAVDSGSSSAGGPGGIVGGGLSAGGGLNAAGVRPTGAIHQVKAYPRLWQLPLFGAALLMIAGMWIPFFRNLVGVGAAFLFFAVALQMQFRRKN